jgi:predicted dehydrogenase
MSGSGKAPAGLKSEGEYALAAAKVPRMEAPALPYGPPMPKDRSIRIALIGAGGISAAHLDAYQKYGLNVVAICDRNLDRAEARRNRFFPNAMATVDVDRVLQDASIRIVDLAMHVDGRVPLMRRALDAGKHVLSQKPFVSDLAIGAELAELAEGRGRFLAVNQNGRWAPYMSYMREAVRAGLVGDVISVHAALQWDHSWIAGTPFEALDQIILQDFAIHWFDFLASIIGDSATSVYAMGTAAKGQSIASRLLAQSVVAFPGGQASLIFDGAARHGASNITTIVGTRGTLRSQGPDLGEQAVSIYLEEGVGAPALEGHWFNDGFAGAMGALLVAVETGTAPIHNARDNLASLKLVHAALQSARTGTAIQLR